MKRRRILPPRTPVLDTWTPKPKATASLLEALPEPPLPSSASTRLRAALEYEDAEAAEVKRFLSLSWSEIKWYCEWDPEMRKKAYASSPKRKCQCWHRLWRHIEDCQRSSSIYRKVHGKWIRLHGSGEGQVWVVTLSHLKPSRGDKQNGQEMEERHMKDLGMKPGHIIKLRLNPGGDLCLFIVFCYNYMFLVCFVFDLYLVLFDPLAAWPPKQFKKVKNAKQAAVEWAVRGPSWAFLLALHDAKEVGILSHRRRSSKQCRWLGRTVLPTTSGLVFMVIGMGQAKLDSSHWHSHCFLTCSGSVVLRYATGAGTHRGEHGCSTASTACGSGQCQPRSFIAGRSAGWRGWSNCLQRSSCSLENCRWLGVKQHNWWGCNEMAPRIPLPRNSQKLATHNIINWYNLLQYILIYCMFTVLLSQELTRLFTALDTKMPVG